MECFKRFRHIDSHFASKQILKGFERSNHKRVKKGFYFPKRVTVDDILITSIQHFVVCSVFRKSTFFNVLTKSQAAAENFPFCTIGEKCLFFKAIPFQVM